jgi:hypothetical protein
MIDDMRVAVEAATKTNRSKRATKQQEIGLINVCLFWADPRCL